MVRDKDKVYVLFCDRSPFFDAVPNDGKENVIHEFSFTTSGDAIEFMGAVGDDAWGWQLTSIFWNPEEAVKHVEECLARSATGEQQHTGPESCPRAVVRERPPQCRGGASTSEGIMVIAVYGEDQTVASTVKHMGMGEAIKRYVFSTEEDPAEFLRALEYLLPWGEASCHPTMEDAAALQEYLRGTPA